MGHIQGLNITERYEDSEKGCSLAGFVEEGVEASMVKDMISEAFSLGLNLGFNPYIVAL